MTTPPTQPRARHLGALGVAFYALLSPSGKIISSATAATLLVGGLVTQLRPPAPPAAQAPAPTPVVPARLAHSGSSAPVFTYIEVDGQTLPVVLTENPTGNSSSAGQGLASASPSHDLSGGGGRGPGAGSPHFGPRQGSQSAGPGGLPREASQPRGFPPAGNPSSATPIIPPVSRTAPLGSPLTHGTPGGKPNASPDSASPNPSPREVRPGPTPAAASDDPAGHKEPSEAGLPPAQGAPGNASRESPDNVPGRLTEAPEPLFTPGKDAAAPMLPMQDEPRNERLGSPFPGNVASPYEAPESEFPTGAHDPLDPSVPLSAQPDPLLTAPYDDSQSLQQTAEVSPAAVPEPSVILLMLLGLAGLGWTARSRPSPTRRA